MKTRNQIWVTLFLFLMLLVFIPPVIGIHEDPGLNITRASSLSPINPGFTRFLNDERSRLDMETSNPSILGLVPATVDFSYLTGSQISNFDSYAYPEDNDSAIVFSIRDQTSSAGITTSALPGSYDLREKGKVNSVKDQGECGCCWAFSTLTSLESALKPESWDFSENNMRNSHGFDLSSCQGGNAQMATAYLARWSGPVMESSDPYTATSGSATAIIAPNPAAEKHIQEVLFIPGRAGPLDNGNLKKTITEKGAIYSTIRWEESSYRPSTAGYYYSGSSTENHAITIVGWDDSFDRYKFTTPPPGDGAFIVKNSWGSDWGTDGFFYVSYYDSVIGDDNAFFSAERSNNYNHIYQYDPLGWIVSYGDKSETAFFANIFTAQSPEKLAAVSFYTPSTNSKYQISIYSGVQSTPVSGSLQYSQAGTIGVPGYHTIDLTTPVALQKGDRFSVVVKLTTPGYQYPVAIEYPLSGFSSKATSSEGQSFVSTSGTLWTDLSSIYRNSNVCLKAFTIKASSSSNPVPASSPTPSPTQGTTDTRAPVVSIASPRAYSSFTPGSVIQVMWSTSDNVAVTGVAIGYSINKGQTWVTAARNLVSSGTYALNIPTDCSGTFMIRVTARDAEGNEGSAVKSCIITTSSSGTRTRGFNNTITPGTSVTHTATQILSLSMDNRIPTISITSPLSHSTIVPGSPVQVAWDADDDSSVPAVDLWVSKDHGITWETVTKNLPSSGTYSFDVPSDVSGDTFLIRFVARDSAGNEGSSVRSCIIRPSPYSPFRYSTVDGRVPVIPIPTS